jgi:lysophospholipase L1-like esterase
VPELLGEEYEVFQPADNCRFVKYTLRMLFDLKSQIEGSDVIHWNNGLWDIPTGLFEDGEAFTSEQEYVENMLRVAKILKTLGKRVVFATTTPVREENVYNKNEVIKRYNALIVPQLEAMGIEINDLHATVMQDVNKYICEDLLHLSNEGIEICAKQVADKIKAEN